MVQRQANAAVRKNIFIYNYTPFLHIEANQLYKMQKNYLSTITGELLVRKSMLIISIIVAVLQN